MSGDKSCIIQHPIILGKRQNGTPTSCNLFLFMCFFVFSIKNFLHCVNAENVCVISQSYLASETFASVSEERRIATEVWHLEGKKYKVV